METTDRPTIITLCGSTRFKKQFEEANAALTMRGCIVLSVGFFEQSEGISITDEAAELFERLHYHKINMSDAILVLNVGGYIGESTRKEIEYAKQNGKSVMYYEK